MAAWAPHACYLENQLQRKTEYRCNNKIQYSQCVVVLIQAGNDVCQGSAKFGKPWVEHTAVVFHLWSYTVVSTKWLAEEG